MNFKKSAILTEPGVKYFLSETLKNVNKEKKLAIILLLMLVCL